MSAGAIVARRAAVMVPLGELESIIATRIAPPSALLELELDEPTALASAVAERGARSAAACSVMREAAALAAARFGIAIPRLFGRDGLNSSTSAVRASKARLGTRRDGLNSSTSAVRASKARLVPLTCPRQISFKSSKFRQPPLLCEWEGAAEMTVR